MTNIGELVTWDDERPILHDAAFVVDGGKVAWFGQRTDAPAADAVRDVGGAAVIPGFVDSHTHLVFAGDRSAEFEARMTGEPYAAGGIRTTVAATRAATDEQLAANVARHLAEMRAQGTTTVEIKSGYGLTVHDEARSLAIAKQFTDETTFLGAHVVPAESEIAAYVELVTGEMLERCAPYARWIDVFCEDGAFGADESRTVLEAGIAAGLLPRIHANQLGLGPACSSPPSSARPPITAPTCPTPTSTPLADSGVVAGLLPGVEFSTRQPYPDARRLLDAGVTVCAGDGLQPRQLLHVVDAVLHRRRRARHGHEPTRGAVVGDQGWRGVAAPRRRRTSGSRREGRLRGAQRPVVRPPRLPPRRPARRRLGLEQ